MTSAVTIDDFINLIKPGELTDITYAVEQSLVGLTTTAMSAIATADLVALGPLISGVCTAAGTVTLPTTAEQSAVADVQRIKTAYATLSPILKTYSPPTIDTTVIAPASTIPAYATVLDYIKQSMDDLGSILIPDLIQQNAKSATPVILNGLITLITAYIAYMNGIIKAFKVDPTAIEPNYATILSNIEKTLTKLNITVPSPDVISITILNTLAVPYTGPAATPPPQPLPSGRICLSTSVGLDTAGRNKSQFPTPTQMILEKGQQNRQTGYRYNPPAVERAPPIGSLVSGMNEMTPPGMKVVAVDPNYPLPNAPTTMGYLVTLSTPIVGWDFFANVQKTVGYWYPVFTYPPDPAEDAAAKAYAPFLVKWRAGMRPTPNPVIVEITNSMNTSLNALMTASALTPINISTNITAIQAIPNLIDGLAQYIKANMGFFAKIGTDAAVTTTLNTMYPIPAATMTFFTSLSSNSFVTNLTTPTTGIIPFLSANYFVTFPTAIVVKLLTSCPTSGPLVDLASSIMTKFFKYYLGFLNGVITAFGINLSQDPPLPPLLSIVTKMFAKTPFTLLIGALQIGGKVRRTRRKHKHRRARRRTRTKRARR